jgi:hypothetical protein
MYQRCRIELFDVLVQPRSKEELQMMEPKVQEVREGLE